MQEIQNDELFTEITPVESASVNGAYSSCRYSFDRDRDDLRPYPNQHYMYYPRRERTYRTVVVLRYE